MNTIQRKIPNKIKSNLLLDGNLSGMLITHAIIQGTILVLLIILFGFTENMHIFSVVTSAMMVVLITHIITFILYKSGHIEFQMKKGREASLTLTGWVLSPIGVLVQLLFSSTFNAIIFWNENLPGWETHFSVGFTNIIGIILGVSLSSFFVYLFFFKEEDYSTKEYYEKMVEYSNLYPSHHSSYIITKTDEFFEYGIDDYDYSREIVAAGEETFDESNMNTDVLTHEEEDFVDIYQKENEIKTKTYNSGKTIRQKR